MLNLPDEKVGCHHTGFEKKCRQLVCDGVCNRWIQIIGTNPNTGEPVNQFDCVDNWTPMLLIENSQLQRQTGAAVESFRNVAVGPRPESPYKEINGSDAVPALEHR